MRHRARILVVDDDMAARERLVDALAEAGFETAACASATGAVRSVAVFRPDLVILEMVLPDAMGAELASRLRADGDLALFFVTRDARLDDRLVAFASGADDYLVKPYVLDELLARTRALLRRTGRHRSLVTKVGRLVVDEGAHRVLVADATVDLGATDFAVLAVLARHAGQVLSKRRLLELVWGYDAVDENLVEVHVSILRRRLGPDAAGLIETVRGVGYVLREGYAGSGPAG
jgi:two-component system, OmpR family, response regulator